MAKKVSKVSPQFKDIVVRASKTFLQGFLAAWALTDFNVEKGAVVGAAAAGFSVLMNFLLEVVSSKKN